MQTVTAAEYRRRMGLAPASELLWQCLEFAAPMPPSVNHAYATVRGRRVLSREGKAYKAEVAARARRVADGRAAPLWLSLTITLRLPLLFKNGRVRKFDASNRIKLLEDALCEGLGVDDSRVLRLSVEKQDGDGSAMIRVESVFAARAGDSSARP